MQACDAMKGSSKLSQTRRLKSLKKEIAEQVRRQGVQGRKATRAKAKLLQSLAATKHNDLLKLITATEPMNTSTQDLRCVGRDHSQITILRTVGGTLETECAPRDVEGRWRSGRHAAAACTIRHDDAATGTQHAGAAASTTWLRDAAPSAKHRGGTARQPSGRQHG